MKGLIRRTDLILAGAIIIIALAAILFFNMTKSEGSKVVVTVNHKVYKTFPLDEDTTFTVKSDNGGWNTFTIKDGYVDMTGASCPDKICVNHKKIHYNHETIVCLPNQVVLEIINGEENDVDATAS